MITDGTSPIKNYNIVFSTSREKDLQYLAVAIRSLLDYFSRPSELKIHILRHSLAADQMQKLWESLADLPCEFQDYDVSTMVGDRIEQPGFGYWAYFWIIKLLPESVEKILYLDCDMMIYDDIVPLLDTDLTGYALAATVDPGSRVLGNQFHLNTWAQQNGYPYDPDNTPYINSGMLYLNLRVWRNEKLLEFLDGIFYGNYDGPRFHDQDALNLFLGARTKLVSPRWNLLEILEFWDDWDFEIQTAVDRPQEYFRPAIKHFAGFQKPDTALIRISDREHYYHYLDKTWWRGTRAACAVGLFGRLSSEMLEFRYILLRGFHQKALADPWSQLWKSLKRAPYIPLLYPLFHLNRLVQRLLRDR